MNLIARYFIIFVFLVATQTGFSQVVTPYQLGTWSGFRTCAISYTFDDGCANQFAKAIPIFNAFNFKLTLFTVSSWTTNWNNLQNAAIAGHEVANHTATHPYLNSLTLDKQKTELETSNNLINSQVTTQKSVTMATPYCAEGNDALAKQYFIAVRGCQGFIEPKTPGNIMNVSSIICGNQGSIVKVKDFKTKADQAATAKGWLVYLIHGIDNDGGYSPLGSDTLKASLQYLKANDSKFWVNTFGNIARYIKERNCVSVKETILSDSIISLAVSDTLTNNEWYNFPLTLRRNMPVGWTSATITQNGNPVNTTIVEANSVKYLQFDAIPDQGSVLISKANITGLSILNGSPEGQKLKVWINRKTIFFTIPSSSLPSLSFLLVSSEGKLIFSSDHFQIDGGTGKVTPETLTKSGVYIAQLTDKRSSWSSKIVLSK